MRKIDKSQILSRDYKKWLENFLGKEHPKYNSSNFKHYNDIRMSLLYCQESVCAYTEKLLCDTEHILEKHWDIKKYTLTFTSQEKQNMHGDLDHFDPNLKSKQAWLWDNFFVVDMHVNRNIKNKTTIENVLKPDNADYDPCKYLEFDYETGVFFPNISLSNKDKEKVRNTIKVLGINSCLINRQQRLKHYVLNYECSKEIDINEYFTAWNMTLKSLELKTELNDI